MHEIIFKILLLEEFYDYIHFGYFTITENRQTHYFKTKNYMKAQNNII